MRDDHDLDLPSWGPYGKMLAGVAAIGSKKDGSLFECALIPAFFKGPIYPPMQKWESGWFTASADSRLRHWETRHEMGSPDTSLKVNWHQQASGVGAKATFLNSGTLPVKVELIAALWRTEHSCKSASILLPQGAIWKDALEMIAYSSTQNSHRLRQNRAAAPWGAYYLNSGFTGGHALGPDFPCAQGDRADYQHVLISPIKNAKMLIRYHRWSEGAAWFTLFLSNGEKKMIELTYEPASEFALTEVALGDLPAGSFGWSLLGHDAAPVLIDGFVILSDEAISENTLKWQINTPSILPTKETVGDDRASWSFSEDESYRLSWSGVNCHRVRRLRGERLVEGLCGRFLDLVRDEIHTPGEGYHCLLHLGPLVINGGEKKSINLCLERLTVRSTSKQKIRKIQPGHHLPESDICDVDERRGVELLAANLATNVSYPHRFRGSFVKAEVPGMFWDSFYSWDIGFVGIGMAVIDVERSWATLAVYLTELDDPYAAFLESGTPLPVQVYQLYELWQRSGDRERLAWAFPRVMQFYRWFVGRGHGSSNARLGSGLLQTWDYNYNSGGWDDYPPQHFLAQHTKRRACIAPMVTNSHAIRSAKLLMALAEVLGEKKAISELEADYKKISNAIQKHAWDKSEGWFSYIEHASPSGKAKGIMRHSSGQNFNRGFDGLSPLIAGICTEEQVQRLLKNVFDPQKLWTPFGPTTVDRSAAYYNPNGYWNGSIWMPHLWFLWKTLLDLGRGVEAVRIASIALQLWTRETRTSNRCYEHFCATTGRGQGWHHFGGLSSPIISFYEALRVPYTFTSGFDCILIDPIQRVEKHTRIMLKNAVAGAEALWRAPLGANMDARLNGRKTHAASLGDGLHVIQLPTGVCHIDLLTL